MSSAKYFLLSQILKDDRVVEIDGQPVVDRHGLISRIVAERCGRETANLFAEPRLTRGNGVAAARIDWYSAFDGMARPLAELDPGSTAAVRQKLEVRLAAIRALLSDAEIGPFLSAALNLARPDGIMSVGGEPVLILWGTLPAGAFDDLVLRERLFSDGLAPFLPGAPLPALSREDWRQSLPAAAPAPLGGPSAPAGAAAAGPDRMAVPVVVRTNPGLLAPVVACVMAALFAAVLFWPGFLVFPAPARGSDGAAKAALADLIGKLQAKLAVLDAELQKDCTVIRGELGRLFPRQAADIPVTVPPMAAVGGQQQATPGSPAAEPPPTEAPVVRPPEAAPASGPMNLADRADRGVVLVATAKGSGTGFFISRDTIVTNRHVVVESQGEIRAISKYIGVLPAKLLAMGPGDHYDFAVLRVAPQSSVAPFVLTTSAQQLEPVVSSGFPGLQLESDPAVQRLLEGDATGLGKVRPNAAPGAVMSLLQQDDAMTLVVHTATIAPGNSGGPLLDQCGRVVGVNTFGVTDRKMPVTFFYALGVDGLKRFLTSKGFAVTVEDSACSPQVAAAPQAPPTGTPAPGTPAPGTPAPGTPAPGTPAPGTPAPGTPAPAVPASPAAAAGGAPTPAPPGGPSLARPAPAPTKP